MYVKIGPYKGWLGPYQLADILCFWVPSVKDSIGRKEKPEWVHKFGEWLAHGSIRPDPKEDDPPRPMFDQHRHKTALYRFLLWVDKKRSRKEVVRIHPYDVWNMNNTLALIIVPMLQTLQDTCQGAPLVDDKDVPVELRSTSAPPLSEDEKLLGHSDDFFFKRWDWVLGEMIFAFENMNVDWEQQFYSGDSELSSTPSKVDENGKIVEYTLLSVGNVKIDRKGIKQYQKRIDNGLRLFGKYYQCLWS